MAKYRFDIAATYSARVTVEAGSLERARDLATDLAPNWVSFGSEMAYAEAIEEYPVND